VNAYKDERHGLTSGGWQPDTARAAKQPASKPSGRKGFGTALRTSRRTRLLAALALIVVCGSAVPVLATSLAPKSTQVLAAAREMPPGTVINAGDLAVVAASGPAGSMMSATAQSSIIGQTVRADVPAGALLNQADLGVFPPIGQSVVPVAVKPGQYPADLQIGRSVAIYPVATGTTDSPTNAQHAAATATVTGISPVASDGSDEVVLDLEVANTSASVIAQASAVVLVGLDPRGDAP
jgi:hypothetical protein